MPPPLQVDNIFAYIHQVAPVPACWLFKTSATIKLTFDLVLLTLKMVSESRVTWAICANFSLPRPLCSRLRPDIRDRQTDVRRQADVRQKHKASLNASALWRWRQNNAPLSIGRRRPITPTHLYLLTWSFLRSVVDQKKDGGRLEYFAFVQY